MALAVGSSGIAALDVYGKAAKLPTIAFAAFSLATRWGKSALRRKCSRESPARTQRLAINSLRPTVGGFATIAAKSRLPLLRTASQHL